jgi:DUF438 domain-containing protein
MAKNTEFSKNATNRPKFLALFQIFGKNSTSRTNMFQILSNTEQCGTDPTVIWVNPDSIRKNMA